MKINITLKIIVIILLLITFLSPPYFYFQLLRWAVFIISIYLAYNYYENKDKEYKIIILWIIAIAFNPISPIYFWKELWQIIDWIVILLYWYLIFDKRKISNI